LETVELTETKRTTTQTVSLFVTWETLAWGGVLLIALLLRFGNLGSAPLSMSESANALLAWNTYLGKSVASMPSGGLLTYGNALIFFLFVASDVSARLLPALCGMAVVALPLGLRKVMGRTPALIAAFLLAISPSMVQYSRRLDNVMLVAVLGGLILVAAVNLVQGGSRRWSYVIALATGALLVAGPIGYTFFLAAGIAGFALLWHWWPTRESDVRSSVSSVLSCLFGQSEAPARLGQGNRISSRYAIVVASAAIFIATGLLTNLAGMQQGLIDALDVWGRGVVNAFSANGLPTVLAYLVTYEPILAGLGISSAVVLALRQRVWWGGALLWGQIGIILAAAFTGQLAAIALILLPLSLSAGWAGERLLNGLRDRARWNDVMSFVGMMLILLWLNLFAQSYFTRPNPVVDPSVAFIPLVLLLLALGLFIFGYGLARLRLPLLALLCVLLVMMAFHTVALPSASPFGLVSDAPISSDVRTLVSDLKQSSDAMKWLGPNRKIRVDSALEVPLAWYLRDINVTYSQKEGANDYLVVTVSDQPAPSWQRVFRNYILGQTVGPGEGFGKWWVWYFYREPAGEMNTHQITLSIRM
jgi:hypothetical protein